MKNPTQPGSIVGRYELAIMFGVKRQAIAAKLDHPDFPPPICLQGKNRSPLYFTKDVERFAREQGVNLHPLPDASPLSAVPAVPAA